MDILAIDPGKHALGWSAWGDGRLVDCGLARAEGRDLGALATSLASQVPGGADLAVVERMVSGYKRIEAQGGGAVKATALDLLDITGVAAFVAGTSVAPGGRVEWVTAHGWKGEIPKHVTEKRVREALGSLGPEEMEIFQAAFNSIKAKSLRHNMVDGVGIGLWYLRRVKR